MTIDWYSEIESISEYQSMPRGGARKNAGRKSAWASGCQFVDTQTIRVPKAIAAEVLEFARNLDRERTLEKDSISENCRSSVVDGLTLSVCSPLGCERLTRDQLAERLGVSPATVKRTRSKKMGNPRGFLEWSRRRDPQGWGWEYDSDQKIYVRACV